MLLIPAWSILYGLAVYSAGFFLPNGLKLFGWLFIFIGCLLLSGLFAGWDIIQSIFYNPHWLMGAIFGGLHLACGIYLYFTEKRGKAS